MKTLTLILLLACNIGTMSPARPIQQKKLFYYSWAIYKTNPSSRESHVLYSKVDHLIVSGNPSTHESNMSKIMDSWQQYLKRKRYQVINEATEWHNSEDEARKAWADQRAGYIANSTMKIEPQVNDWAKR
ncbi:hypothetical protein [Dyadobacter fermentans]|uniref:Uncharacterized protein n=1 Tax=Dyadobacter fermentans (strain ATCC 700827 / DSM 18053 / CIP 107007 / KCTC 52180 / NS114) TaxID=471854 RepID=C6VZM5_DYAFD|nr:hypothetical protein [Dyadobacter fermentans]ACT93503.1 hypothetical protein Dfer_2282 [Dyadobacter fermentans DSM 18053]